MSQWDKLSRTWMDSVSQMTPSQVAKLMSDLKDQAGRLEDAAKLAKLKATFVSFRAAEIFEANNMDKMTSGGYTFYHQVKTKYDSKVGDRKAFCENPGETWAEAKVLLETSVNAAKFSAWCSALKKENKALPSFVKVTELTLVTRRKS